MNKMIFIILFFITSYSYGINLEIISSEVLDTSSLENMASKASIDMYRYGTSSGLAFCDKNNLLFITLVSNEIANNQGIVTSSGPSKAYLLAVFDNEGNYKNSVGQINNYANGGIINISCLKIANNTLYTYDPVTKRVSAFQITPTDFNFLHSIDTSRNLNSYSFIIKDDIFWGSKPESYLRANDNSGFIAKIIDDENYPQSKELDLLETIIPSTAYRSFIGYDYKETMKLLGYEEDYLQENPNMKYIWETLATGGIYATVLYESYNGFMFAVNTYGTEIFKFDSSFSVIDTIQVEDFHNFRKEEKEIYETLENRNLRSFHDKYSKLDGIIINEERELIFLYYCHSSTIAEIKGYDKFLFIFSIKDNRFIETFYPIDFIPVSSFEDTVVGLNIDGERLCLEYYHIEE